MLNTNIKKNTTIKVEKVYVNSFDKLAIKI